MKKTCWEIIRPNNCAFSLHHQANNLPHENRHWLMASVVEQISPGKTKDQRSTDSCSICLRILSDVGKPNGCLHEFWYVKTLLVPCWHSSFECINEWCKVENKCPLCKKRLTSLSRMQVEHSLWTKLILQDGKLVVIKIKDKIQVADDPGAEGYLSESESESNRFNGFEYFVLNPKFIGSGGLRSRNRFNFIRSWKNGPR